MNKKWKKKIALCLGGLALGSTGTAVATTYSSPILSGVQTFNTGDEVQINGANQFGIKLWNSGDTMTTNGKLIFNFTTSLLPTSTIEAISLKNGGLNTLGTGSEITVVTAPSVNYPADAITIGKNGTNMTSVSGSDLKINISGQGGQTGIRGVGNINLGANTQITTTSAASSAVGLNLGGGTLQASNIKINSTGQTTAIGMSMYQNNTTITGQNNSITAKSNGSNVTGIWVDGGASGPSHLSFDRVDINVEAASLGDAQGIFSYMKDSTVNLGSGSTITTKNAMGVVLSATAADPTPVNSTFTADQLTLTTQGAGAHGIQSLYGSTVNLTDSTITTDGANAFGLILAGGATNNVTNSVINVKGATSYGAYITEIGTPQKSPSILNLTNTQMTSTNHGIYVRSTTMTDKNQGVGAITINAKNSDITSSAGYGIRALGSETTLNMNHSTLTSASGMAAVHFEAKIAGDKLDVNLANQSIVNGEIYSVGVTGISNALGVNADQSQVLGDLTATAGSTLNAKFGNNSYWQGKGQYLAAGDTLNVELDHSNWDMIGNSQLSSLTLNSGGNVNFQTNLTGGSYGTLTVGNLSGSDGIFNMRTNMAAGEAGALSGAGGGDLVSVTGTTVGNHLLNIQNQGGAVVSPTYEHLVVETADGGGNFGLTHKVEVGAYQYDIHRDSSNQNNWSLFRTEELTPAAAAAANEPRAGYYLNYAETQTLIQRMGDLRNNPESAGNVWAKMVFGENKVNSTSHLPEFDQSYSGIQIGADKQTTWMSGNFYTGVFAGYTNGSQDYATGSGEIDSRYLGAYGTYIGNSGFYVDGVLKFGWLNQSFQVNDTAGKRVTSDSSTNGAMVSLEAGQRNHFNKETKQGFYLEPQAQISWGHQSGDDFTATNGLSGSFDSYNYLLGRVGLLAGYELEGGKNPINVYAKTSYNHEFDGKYGTTMGGTRIDGDLGDSWWSYGVGVTTQVNNVHNFYADVERASGGDFTQSWKVNVGYRYQW